LRGFQKGQSGHGTKIISNTLILRLPILGFEVKTVTHQRMRRSFTYYTHCFAEKILAAHVVQVQLIMRIIFYFFKQSSLFPSNRYLPDLRPFCLSPFKTEMLLHIVARGHIVSFWNALVPALVCICKEQGSFAEADSCLALRCRFG
jgi:hypothetical protein